MPSDDFNADVRTPPTRHVYKGSARLDTTTIGSGLVLAPAGDCWVHLFFFFFFSSVILAGREEKKKKGMRKEFWRVVGPQTSKLLFVLSKAAVLQATNE